MFVTLLVVTTLASLATAAAIGRWLRHRHLAVGMVAAVLGGLATASVIWLLIAGLFLAAAVELWPLSRRQGPDTAFSRACYTELLGAAPPADVTDIYCRKEWGFGGDSIDTMCFTFQESSTVQVVVARLQLEAACIRAEPGSLPERSEMVAGTSRAVTRPGRIRTTRPRVPVDRTHVEGGVLSARQLLTGRLFVEADVEGEPLRGGIHVAHATERGWKY